jgi:hypothetical protein
MPNNQNTDPQPLTNTLLPNRNHGSAPKFDGKPWPLHHFLTEVRTLSNERGFTDKRAIEVALTYAPTSEFELWKSLPAAKGNKWDAFMEALVKIYPGAGGDGKFSKNDPKLLVGRSSQVPMADQVILLSQFHQYCYVTFLEEKNEFTPVE